MGKTTYFKYQSKLLIPVVFDWWDSMIDDITERISRRPVNLAGDGQCDSLGFSAKYLCYYVQDIATDEIVDVEIVDKRFDKG